MCGISGLISREPVGSREISSVEAMNQALGHRGPDSKGQIQDTHIVLAVRRLRIIDLPGGDQPLYNEDRSLVLIANGEIYNFLELRSELIAQGHQFRTGSDCESIIHLYEQYGSDCVHYLRGMFAFALWDSRRQRLLLARDRMGEKPLYLYERPGQLIFASELKALLKSGLVPFELDPIAINSYFYYFYVPEPATPIAEVRKLSAAHMLTIDVKPWQMQETCYWRMEDAPFLDGDPVERVRAELETTCELAIRSDVPVGIALSGGLDSSAIAALTTQKYPGRIHAFSVGYPGRPRRDERVYAKAVADYLDMPFHEVELPVEDMVTFFPELVYWRDDPIADISGYGYFSVMKLAREHGVPVMMQGQGGDEIFWGYRALRNDAHELRLKAALLRKGKGALIDYLKPKLPDAWSRRDLEDWVKSLAGLRTGWKRFQRHRASPPERMVFSEIEPYLPRTCKELRQVCTGRFLESVDDTSIFELFTLPQWWSQIDVQVTRLICQTYLLENGIAQGDRLSMASSVELRLPLVDYRLVEVVMGLRKTESDFRLPPKAWLKAAVKDLLPEWVMHRPMWGFSPPIHLWHDALFASHGSTLEEGYLVQEGILESAGARELAKGSYPRGNGVPLSFKALVLETWCRKFSHLA